MVTAIFVVIAILVVWQVVLPAQRSSTQDKLQRKKFTPAAISAKEVAQPSDDIASALLEPTAGEMESAELLRSMELQFGQGRSESEVIATLREQQWDEQTIMATLEEYRQNNA